MRDDFYKEICKEKDIVRTGWKRRNLPGRLESDAEHTYSMTLLALELLAKNKELGLDELKILKMIAYHELGEIEAGDITPFDNVPLNEKLEKEHKCVKRISETYDMPEIDDLWVEFNEGKTKEAQFVKTLDKFDAVLQSKIYAERFGDKKLFEDFKNNAIDKIKFFDNLKF